MCHLSGKNSKTNVFQHQLPALWTLPGEQVLEKRMKTLCQSGNYTVGQGKLIPFFQL